MNYKEEARYWKELYNFEAERCEFLSKECESLRDALYSWMAILGKENTKKVEDEPTVYDMGKIATLNELVNGKPEDEPKEETDVSLEEKEAKLFIEFCEEHRRWEDAKDEGVDDLLLNLEEIAREHFQKNPEEIASVTEYYKLMEQKIHNIKVALDDAREIKEGMVSLDSVLETFDRAVEAGETTKAWEDYTNDIRQAIERMRK